MRIRSWWRTGRVWAVVTLAAACGDPAGPEPPEPRAAELRLTGDGQTDTVTARLVQALVAEVHDTLGLLLDGETVRFEALPADTLFPWVTSVDVARLDSDDFGGFAADTTGADGRAAVVIRLGTRAGPGLVAVSVPRLGLVDTARFTIAPGGPATVVAQPADTALYVGASFQLRGRVVDRFGNARTDPVTYTGLDPAITVSAAGVVGAQAVGRGRVQVHVGASRDTAWISVVPQGTFAASGYGAVVVAGLDGSGRQEFPLAGSPNGYYPSWPSPSTAIAVTAEGRLHLLELTGASRRVITGPDSGLTEEAWPVVSRDGSHIYFTGVEGYATVQIWRVGADGSGLERLSPYAGTTDSYPSPSPDGSRVAFVTTRNTGYLQLAVLDLATRMTTELGRAVVSVRWAPQSNRIAYLDESTRAVWIVNADGTGARQVTPSGRSYEIGIGWSPDEQWMLVSTYQYPSYQYGIELVNVATGVSLPIPGTQGLTQPVWKP